MTSLDARSLDRSGDNRTTYALPGVRWVALTYPVSTTSNPHSTAPVRYTATRPPRRRCTASAASATAAMSTVTIASIVLAVTNPSFRLSYSRCTPYPATSATHSAPNPMETDPAGDAAPL